MTAFEHILVPTDFGDASNEALSMALEVAKKFAARVTILHVTLLAPEYLAYAEGPEWPTDELDFHAKRQLDDVVARAKREHPRVEGVVDGGEPWERILATAKERGADLIVMGTHGRRGISRLFLGSVAEKVVRLAPVPVLTISAEAERREKQSAAIEASVGARATAH